MNRERVSSNGSRRNRRARRTLLAAVLCALPSSAWTCERLALGGLLPGLEYREIRKIMGGDGVRGSVTQAEVGAFSTARYSDAEMSLYLEYDSQLRKNAPSYVVRLTLSTKDTADDSATALIAKFGEPTSGREDLDRGLHNESAVWLDEACGLRLTAERQRSSWWGASQEPVCLTLESIPVVKSDAGPEVIQTVSAEGEPDFWLVSEEPSIGQAGVETTAAAADPTNHVARQTIAPVPVADLALDHSIDVLDPRVGTETVVLLAVRNAGPSAATGVVVRHAPVPGLRLLSADGAGSFEMESGLWRVDRLLAGEAALLRLTALVEPQGPYDGTIEIVAAEQKDSDSRPDNGNAEEDDFSQRRISPVPVADLSLTHTFDDSAAIVQGEITLRLTIVNAGPSPASAVVVTSALPDGLEHLRNDGGEAYLPRTGKWRVGDLAAGDSRTLAITALVNPRGNYVASAEISAASESDPDSAPGNRQADEDDLTIAELTPLALADLALSQEINDATPDVGAEVTISLSVSNGGPSDATGVVVIDRLPSGYLYVAHRGVGAYDAQSGTWRIPALAANTQSLLVIQARVNPEGDYVNVAKISACDQSDPDTVGTPDVSGSVADRLPEEKGDRSQAR